MEDEWLLASSLASELSSVQLEPVGPAATEKMAPDLIDQHEPDAAILDGNLGGEFAYGVAHALRARDIPFSALLHRFNCSESLFWPPTGQKGLRQAAR